MAKRAEEKERRRLERLEAEQAAQKAASRKRTTQIALGAVLAIAAVTAVVLVATAGGGGSGGKVDATKVAADAKAAGCTYKAFRSAGRGHTSGKVAYKTNPPTSGSHNPVAAQDGIYDAGNSPAQEAVVHALEHGRVVLQYKPGASAADVAKLRRIAESELKGTAGYHTLMLENNTKLPAEFAASAWTHSITCDDLSPRAVTALTSFRNAFIDKGPELIA